MPFMHARTIVCILREWVGAACFMRDSQGVQHRCHGCWQQPHLMHLGPLLHYVMRGDPSCFGVFWDASSIGCSCAYSGPFLQLAHNFVPVFFFVLFFVFASCFPIFYFPFPSFGHVDTVGVSQRIVPTFSALSSARRYNVTKQAGSGETPQNVVNHQTILNERNYPPPPPRSLPIWYQTDGCQKRKMVAFLYSPRVVTASGANICVPANELRFKMLTSNNQTFLTKCWKRFVCGAYFFEHRWSLCGT